MNVSGLLRLASILLTAVVAISFGLFVWDELGSASKNQSQFASSAAVQEEVVRDEHGRITAEENGKIRVELDKANDSITSVGESLGKQAGAGDYWAMRTGAFIFGMLIFLLGLRLLATWLEMSRSSSKPVEQRLAQDGITGESRTSG